MEAAEYSIGEILQYFGLEHYEEKLRNLRVATLNDLCSMEESDFRDVKIGMSKAEAKMLLLLLSAQNGSACWPLAPITGPGSSWAYSLVPTGTNHNSEPDFETEKAKVEIKAVEALLVCLQTAKQTMQIDTSLSSDPNADPHRCAEHALNLLNCRHPQYDSDEARCAFLALISIVRLVKSSGPGRLRNDFVRVSNTPSINTNISSTNSNCKIDVSHTSRRPHPEDSWHQHKHQ